MIRDKPPKDEEEKKKQDSEVDEKRNRSLFWTVVATIYSVLFILDYFYLSRFGYEIWGMKSTLGSAAFLAQVFYTIISLRVVGPKELGARLFFGKPLNSVSSGLVFIPFGICQLKLETRLTIQNELPGEPSKIFRKEDVEIVPEGLVPPIRIPFGFPRDKHELKRLDIFVSDGDKEQKLDLDVPPKDDGLNIRITTEVVIIIRWRIVRFVQFLITIGDAERSRKQMEDRAVACLLREFAKITPAVALINLSIYNRKLTKEIEERIKDWGIHLEDAQIKTIGFHHDLNDAIAAVPEETLKAKAVVIGAEAKKKEKELHGKGDGLAEKAVLDGRTKGLTNMAEKLKVTPQVIVGAETARAITENPGQKTIVAGTAGFNDIISVASAIKETAGKEGEK